jgi:hypothetical protein
MYKQAVFRKKPAMYYVQSSSFSAQIKQFISYFALLCEDGPLPFQHVVLLS